MPGGRGGSGRGTASRPASAPITIAATWPVGAGREGHDQRRRDRDAGALPVRAERPRHAPDRLRDDRDRDELEAVQQPRCRAGLASAVAPNANSTSASAEGRVKAAQAASRAEQPAAQQPEREADLAAGRAGQELAERHEVGIARLVDPAPAQHELVAEVAEMRDRAAERGQPELEEGAEHLARRAGRGRAVRCSRSTAVAHHLRRRIIEWRQRDPLAAPGVARASSAGRSYHARLPQCSDLVGGVAGRGEDLVGVLAELRAPGGAAGPASPRA